MDTARIWSDFNRNMRRFLRQRVPVAQDAEDLLQDIFVKIHLKLPTLTKRESLPAWIWQITRNTLLDYHKKNRLRQTLPDLAETLPDEPDPQELNHLLAGCIRPFLDMLPPAQREAIVLAGLEQLPQKMLAGRWNLSYSGAKSRVQRARSDLFELFNQCCRIEADAYGNIMEAGCMQDPGRSC